MKCIVMVLLWICLVITPAYAGKVGIIDRVMVQEKVIALTLEDIENAAELEKVIVLCKENNVHLSFFSPSYFVNSHQAIVKQAISDGHEFGNCGVKTIYWGELREEDITKDFRAADIILQKVCNVQTFLVKPADRQYEEKFLRAVAAFNVRSNVIRGTNIEGYMIEEKDLSFMKNGTIIALSMGDKEAVFRLSELLSILKDKGYQILTVSELLNKK